MNARDFGLPDDPMKTAQDQVRRYVGLSPPERYARFLDLMSFLERIWNSLPAEQRARYGKANDTSRTLYPGTRAPDNRTSAPSRHSLVGSTRSS